MTLLFHDVSSYQPNFHPSGPTSARATKGVVADICYQRFKKETLVQDWPFLSYHTLTATDPPAAQAAAALFSIGRDMPAMLATEVVDKLAPTWFTYLTFINEYRSLGGKLWLAYLPHWYWEGYLKSPSLAPLASAKLSLVSSNYPKAGYTEDGPGWTPYGGMTPTIWQFTDKPVDTNAFRGSQYELRRLIEGLDHL